MKDNEERMLPIVEMIEPGRKAISDTQGRREMLVEGNKYEDRT